MAGQLIKGGAAAVALAVISCTDSSISPLDRGLFTSVEISPVELSLPTGQTATLTAMAVDAQGRRTPVNTSQFPVQWRVEDASVLTLDEAGSEANVTAVATGVSDVEVDVSLGPAFGGAKLRTRATVNAHLAPVKIHLVAGKGQSGIVGSVLPDSLVIRVVDAAGMPVPGAEVRYLITAGGGSVSPVRSVTSEYGYAKAAWRLGMSVGRNAVLATVPFADLAAAESFEAMANPAPTPIGSISVAPANPAITVGGSVQVVATIRDVNGAVISAPVTWSVSNTGIASVSPTGLVTGLNVGTTSVVATAGSKIATAQINVLATSPSPCTGIARVTISPSSLTMSALNETRQLSSTAYDVYGSPLPSVGITWSSSSSTIATVSVMGLVTARNIGSAMIVAAAVGCGQADTINAVINQVITFLTVSPGTASIVQGDSLQMNAAAADAGGNPITNASISWSTSAPSIAAVDTRGRVRGVAAGAAVISAAAGGVTASAALTVTPPMPIAAFVHTCVFLACNFTDQSVGSIASRSWSFGNGATSTATNPAYTYATAGTYSVRLTITDIAGASASITRSVTVTASAPPPPPPPPGGFVPPDIAWADFENGTLGGFLTGDRVSNIGKPGTIDVITDPTGKLSGKVVRLHFQRNSTSQSADVNRAIVPTVSFIRGLGETFFAACRFVVPTPAANMMNAQRKLFYFQRAPNDGTYAILNSYGTRLVISVPTGTGGQKDVGFAGALPYDTPVHLEVQVTGNSAVGVPDGIVRVWKDGVLLHQATNVNYFWTTSGPFARYALGEQSQMDPVDTSILFDEYRYLDNCAVSTQRIGPK
jgi:hypothetical protein